MQDTVSELLRRIRLDPGLRTPLLAAVLWGLLYLAGFSSQWELLERKGFDLLTVATAPGRSTLPITIVGIDEASFAELGLRWPWPRGLHGQLIDRLSQAGAAVVGFDVLLPEASDPEQDAVLAAAIKRAGNVVLAADQVYQETNYTRQWIRVDPLHQFTQAGAASGLASVTLDGDQEIRQLPGYRDAFWRAILAKFEETRPGLLPPFKPPEHALIRYLGPDHTFPYVSYYQALDPDKFLPKDFFRDQIVLVGRDIKASPEAGAAQADSFATPFTAYTGWLTPGVEVHATILENVVAGLAWKRVPKWATPALLAATLLLSALLMAHWRPLLSALAGLLIMAVVVLLALWLRYRNLWIPSISSLSGVVLMYMGQGGIAFLSEQRHKRELKHAFQHYVPPHQVERIIAHPEELKLGGQKREVTLLFTDLQGFTAISEQMSPEEITHLLNRHLTEMTRIILAHDGTVVKFIGDAIMVIWGAPLDDPRQAVHACQAAREMQRAMEKMRERLAEEGLPPLYMRVGIHSGEAVVGNMGSDNRFDYTAIGDTVNLASRLEGVNKLYGTGIMMSGSVASQLSDDFPLRRVDTVRVKGKEEPVDIFTLCEDARLNELGGWALEAYRQARWVDSEVIWREILQRAPGDGIAAVYLERIAEFRLIPPPAGWDGTVSLEKM